VVDPEQKIMADHHVTDLTTDWSPLPGCLDQPETPVSLTRRQLRLWQLTLEARGFPVRTEQTANGWQILVPAETFEEAIFELQQYQRENHGWPPPLPPPIQLIDNRLTTLWVLIAIGLFHNLTMRQGLPFTSALIDWTAIGNAHAGKILDGEWWRLITALTLHSSGLHFLSNLVFGGVFIMRLCRLLGSGLGWSLTLASGIGGNLANAWLQAANHRAVGASTAVFGAVGLLAAISMIRYRHNLRPQRRWALPLAAGAGLLAMLGTGGENTDLGAHLWGFVCGLLIGAAVEVLRERRERNRAWLGWLSGSASIALVIAAWYVALG